MPPSRFLDVRRLGPCLLILVLAWLGWDTARRAGHLLRLSADYGVTVDAPAIDPYSPTGYMDGRRSLLLPVGAADGAHWVMQTQAQVARGDLRVRHVDYDHAPTGRDVHWASLLRWWLAGLAAVDAVVTGQPIGAALERAALWSGPVMLAIALPLLFLLVRRTVSPAAAALVPVAVMAYHPFAIDFLAGRADHHGLANLAALAAVLGFALGDRLRQPSWYQVSAVAAGLGVGLSAVTLVPILIGLGLGLLASGVAFRRAPVVPPWLESPQQVRRWARTGALVCLAAYGIETLPGPFPLRLEVNHPWYALAWWGAGEGLAFLLSSLRSLPSTHAQKLRAAAGMLVLVSLPVTLALTQADTYKVADAFLLALHREHIAEFQPLLRVAGTQGLSLGLLGLVLPLATWLMPLALLRRSGVAADQRASLVLLAGPAILTVLLGWVQVRWLGLAFATGLPLLLVGGTALPNHRRPWVSLALVALLLPGLAAAVQRTLHADDVAVEDLRRLAERDLAHWLRLRAGSAPVVVAAPPGLTTRLIYHGSLRGLGTLYWENDDGLRRLADFYAARSDDEAWQIARDTGLTHVVFASWDVFEIPLIHLRRGEAGRTTLPDDAFLVRLLQAPVPPPWLQALPFPLPQHPALQGAELRVWQVVAPVSPARAANAAVRAALENGRADLAAKLAPQLAAHAPEIAGLLGQATLAATARDERAFVPVLRALQSKLDQAGTLSLGERLQLVSVLALGREFETAREHLRLALAASTDADVRRLSMGQLADLLSLCDALAPYDLRPDLRELTRTLLPPARRR